MFERKYVGVIHPEVVLRYIDFLFYDQFQLMDNLSPTNKDSELLFSSGIIRPMDKSIKIESLKPNKENTDLLSAVEYQERFYRDECATSMMGRDIHEAAGYGKFAIAREISSDRDQSVYLANVKENINAKISIYKTQACAVFLSLTPDIKAIPIFPENNTMYSEFVSGCSLNFMSIGVPKMPIKDLIEFKYDNQDKLRRLRLAISNLYNIRNNYQDAIEEIALSLKSYTKQVELIEKKFELEQMEFKFKLSDGLMKFLTTFNISLLSDGIAMKKSMIQKQIDMENIATSGVSYLYEVGKFVQDRSLAVKI